MKADELRQLSVEELQNRLEDVIQEYENLRFQHSTHQLDNPMLIRSTRREIARIKTMLGE